MKRALAIAAGLVLVGVLLTTFVCGFGGGVVLVAQIAEGL